MGNQKYPTRYELVETLSTLTRAFLNDFAQERGLFMTNVTQPQLVEQLANLFLENSDLEKIRNEAYQRKTQHAISGFMVNSPKIDFDLRSIYQTIFEGGPQRIGQDFTAPRLVDKEEKIYKATYTYRRIKPGRIEFLQDEVTSFDFFMQDKGDGTWQVEVDSSRSTDSKELQALLQTGLRDDVELEELEQKFLTTELSIKFFDELVKSGMSADWKIADIKHLTIRKGNDDDPDDEEKTTEVKEEDLVGISQAILQGKNLRENRFVRQCVKDGYRFNAMTYEFHHVKKPDILVIKAEFKGRPKVFEVSIVGASEHIGIELTPNPVTLPPMTNRIIRSDFWNNAKIIYNAIRTAKKS